MADIEELKMFEDMNILEKKLQYKSLYEQERVKMYSSLYQREIRAKLKLGEYPDKDLQERYDSVIALEKRIEEQTEYIILTDYMFLSVCPPDGTELDTLHKLVIKYCKKIKLLEYLYVIEQRGETEEEIGKGLHAHILIKHTYDRPSRLKTDFYNTFKNIIDIHHKRTSSWLNIRHCNTIDDAIKRKGYMTGVKNDEVKHKKQEMDILFRKKYNLQDSYGELTINVV